MQLDSLVHRARMAFRRARPQAPLSSYLLGALLPLSPATAVAAFNPFCVVVNLIKPWTGGAILLGFLVAGLGYAMSFVTESQFGGRVLKGIGAALIILAVVTGTNVLNDIATGLGITGVDFTCAANGP